MTIPALQVARVSPAAAYFGAAEEFIAGVRGLSVTGTIPGFALSFLAGQALENCLKAYLASTGIEPRALSKKPYGHDLLYLWSSAVTAGLAIDQSPPAWVHQLNSVHGLPYLIRYPMNLNGLILPNSATLSSALPEVADKVRPFAL